MWTTILTVTVILIALSFADGFGIKKNFLIKEKAPRSSTGIELPITKCGQAEYEKQLLKKGGEKPEVFEAWLNEKRLQRKRQGNALSYPVTIRCSVTVIHSGEDIGVGTNINDTQIQSQFVILNDDYRKTANTSGFGQGVDTMIQFTLDDSNIYRFSYTDLGLAAPPYDMTYFDQYVKPATGRNPTYFLNFWTVELALDGNVNDTLLGYSSFPISSGLDGLVGLRPPVTDPSLDGVAIQPFAFGLSDIGNLNGFTGQTASHEVGHWLGLRHIWGDGDCRATDYVSDTPPANGSSSACVHPAPNKCPGAPEPQIENYMDYSPDACRNIFTAGQVERMHTVLENSPRRFTTVINSTILPTVVDLTSVSLIIESPAQDNLFCYSNPFNFKPVITLTNEIISGNSTITTISIAFYVNNQQIANGTIPVDLGPDTYNQITFDPITVPDNLISNTGNYTFTASLYVVNDDTTNPPVVQDVEFFLIHPETSPSTFNEQFDGAIYPPVGWEVANQIGWNLFPGQVQSDGTVGQITGVEIFGTDLIIGSYQLVYLFGVAIAEGTVFSFDYSYALYQDSEVTELGDSLFVFIQNVCNDDTVIVFQQGGVGLSTAGNTSVSFTPTSASDWGHFKQVLTSAEYPGIIGQTISMAFLFSAANGNNIYLDNVRLAQASSDSTGSDGGDGSNVVPLVNWVNLL